MKTNFFSGLGLVLFAIWLAGCAGMPPVDLATVGPAEGGLVVAGSHGYLRVYSATESREVGRDSYYNIHSSYRVFDSSGKFIQFVVNHVGDMDESAALVMLPTGKYWVRAESDLFGEVKVPVAIVAGRTTEVHLGTHWKGPPDADPANLVKLPDGHPVGWLYREP